MSSIKERNSAFELLRIIAQYMIVVYHIQMEWFVYGGMVQAPHVYKAIYIPLHIGVLLYVMISGYFGIRFSLKGLCRIVFYLFIYGLVFRIISHVIYHDHIGYSSLLFISKTDFWFARTYIYLYLVAPLVNYVIRNLSTKNRFIMLLVLGWFSVVGLLGYDSSLAHGKSLVHFIFLYLIGDTLRVYYNKINSINIWYLILGYIFVNIISVGLYVLSQGTSLGPRIYLMVFAYTSPLLIISAVLFFTCFMRMKFHSKVINYVAASCFAIYLIHCSVLFMNHIIRDGAYAIQGYTSNILYQMVLVLLFAIVIMLCCVAIDNVLKPIWLISNRFAEKLSATKVGKLIQEYQSL